MLRKLRIALAALFGVGVTLLLLGVWTQGLGWMAKLQFLPALFRIVGGATVFNVLIVCGILLFTLLFGRIYCSVICPLGIFQDVVIWIRRRLARIQFKLRASRMRRLKAEGKPVPRMAPSRLGKKFSYIKEQKWARYGVLAICIASMFVCGQLLIGILAPYSAYGRMINAIAGDGMPAALLITAAVTFVVIAVSAWVWGRGWCNTICPVGTILGTVSRFSVFHIGIDKSVCNNCGACAKGCRASCIDPVNHKVDGSRCVDCFDCIGNCKTGALSYKLRTSGKAEAPKADDSAQGRREFVKTGAAAIAALTVGQTLDAQEMKVDGGLAEIIAKQKPQRTCELVPFGAGSAKDFHSRCTSCQLCVAACPNGVLRPGTTLENFLQPEMGYDKGYCRPECNECGKVCPSGAIRPMDKGEKLGVRIGTAKVDVELCLAASKTEACGNCERHCPVGAIKMQNVDGVRRPVVMEEQCIGCGACEHLCPVRPISAISVNGLQTHIIK